MKKLIFLIAFVLIASCEKDYSVISYNDLNEMVIQDTLVHNPDHLVFMVGKSISDTYPKLLVKKDNLYLFNSNCGLQNDSVIHSYSSPFVVDNQGEFRKNGIWVYSKFSKEGTFPFHSNVINYNVDSIPKSWNKKRPTEEGIYFYENNALTLFSKEQSEEQFKEYKKDGFYFIPNKGRLFDKINIKDLNN